MSPSPETTLAVDAALRSAAEIAYYHASCHEERGKTYAKPGDEAYTICKFEGQVCREVGDAIAARSRALISPRTEAAITAE